MLSFPVLIWFILQKTNQSAQVCLDSFFEACQRNAPTKSAFTQARASLCPKVFKRLNRLIVRIFYQLAPFKTWKGFRVLAVDGSTLQLPGNHKSLWKKFSHHFFGPKADAGHWMSRISYLYDVFNGIVIDAQMESYTTSEATLCKKHMPFVKKGDMVLYDRYYASYELMFLLMGKGVDFVFRMKDNWWKCVEAFVQSGQEQQEVSLRLPKKYHYLLSKYPHLKETQQIRLIKKTNRKGEVQVFCTSLTDCKVYSRKAILNLYRQRWGIEEAYKLIKSRLEVADFSGMTSWAIQQDFYAKTLLISLCNALCIDIKPKSLTRCKNKKTNPPRNRIINRTYALNHLKVIIRKTTITLEKLQEWLSQFRNKVSSLVEYSRKNQSSPRKLKPNCKHAMNFKPV
jgi:hypothetical protein